jgi:hypothetical protein
LELHLAQEALVLAEVDVQLIATGAGRFDGGRA